MEMGKAEVIRQGIDGTIVVCGGLLKTAMEVADYFISLPEEERRNFGVINARFVKPLDSDTILEPIRQNQPLFTLEEGVLMGGFGSAILEEANRRRLDTRYITRLGIPDRYIQHETRDEQLAEIGLDRNGIISAIRDFYASGFPVNF